MKLKHVLYHYKNVFVLGLIVIGSTLPTVYRYFFSPPPQRLSVAPVPQAFVPTPQDDISAQHPSITIHLAGAVKRPGVYVVPEDLSLVEAIYTFGGGFRKTADLDKANLAKPLKKGTRVYIPFKKKKKTTKK